MGITSYLSIGTDYLFILRKRHLTGCQILSFSGRSWRIVSTESPFHSNQRGSLAIAMSASNLILTDLGFPDTARFFWGITPPGRNLFTT